jgi:hypothetical protein
MRSFAGFQVDNRKTVNREIAGSNPAAPVSRDRYSGPDRPRWCGLAERIFRVVLSCVRRRAWDSRRGGVRRRPGAVRSKGAARNAQRATRGVDGHSERIVTPRWCIHPLSGGVRLSRAPRAKHATALGTRVDRIGAGGAGWRPTFTFQFLMSTINAFALDWDDNGRRFRGYAEIRSGKAMWIYDVDEGQGNPNQKVVLRECRPNDTPAQVRAEIEAAEASRRLAASQRVECPECGQLADFDLGRFPPETVGKIQRMPHMCPNGHQFTRDRVLN